MDERGELLERAAALIAAWEGRFGPVEPHPASVPDTDRLEAAWGAFGERMADHYPFFHPRFAGQMLKPPHRVAAAGYLAAMLVNPNNHALDGGPGTTALEVEAVDALADMFGLAQPRLGHLTSSGTIANLEALWVAREMTGGKAVVHSELAHYTHDRMCRVLGVEPRAVAADAHGRLDLDAVEAACRGGDVGTVVLTAGTTGLGAIDRVDEALALRERYGVRLHVDAAYGGFFTLLARGADPLVAGEPFAAIAQCDSVVVDPHKHGLQPYGCGAVLFADPSVAAVYAHESPYTYFVPADLHLGEISLECSRAGAAAAALWLTLQVFPLHAGDGLGPMLAASRRAALDLAARLRSDPGLTLHVEPELDIVTYFPSRPTLSDVDAATERALAVGMADGADPVFLSTIRVAANAFAQLHPGIVRDVDAARVLRSVLMKPEHETNVGDLHARLSRLAEEVSAAG
ncbi:pyridoxal phosphate-dependent decarboxylase family protein [Capillimicrobium parvum]|uniref:Histidine decarboxylase n=1 Tax=Capillimicrobium parvum TaxID=2884022 RepID=A0A9E6XWZ4_9ACTN|nr:aminotransferase class I/II-fold pyridoxal phosphate-dependent enzyme [Capillimicrobium parvum]UGS35695.1 Histidine decarboxylase [Capillimicrobium parvum]